MRAEEPVISRILGTSRFLVTLAVLGSFVTAAILMVHGLVRSLGLIGELLDDGAAPSQMSKSLIIDAVSIIDVFLLGTVLYIISAGFYQLFVDPDLRLPRWLVIRSIGDLKVRLAGVIVVGMLVAFLGYVIEWQGGTDIAAPALGIAAVVIAVAVYFRLVPPEAAGDEIPGDQET
jgi:uncharacterized membrane protein YqhA